MHPDLGKWLSESILSLQAAFIPFRGKKGRMMLHVFSVGAEKELAQGHARDF